MYLYHFYDKRTGPFKSLSRLTLEEAKSVIEIESPHYMVLEYRKKVRGNIWNSMVLKF